MNLEKIISEDELNPIQDSHLEKEIAVQPSITKESKSYSQKIVGGLKKVVNYYFKPKSFERKGDGLLYKALGVQGFLYILPTFGKLVCKLTGFHPIRNAKTKEKGLRDYESATRIYETTHFMMFWLYLALTTIPFMSGNLRGVLGWSIANILINIYPIMVQRYNRARIYNALEKIEKEKSASDM